MGTGSVCLKNNKGADLATIERARRRVGGSEVREVPGQIMEGLIVYHRTHSGCFSVATRL